MHSIRFSPIVMLGTARIPLADVDPRVLKEEGRPIRPKHVTVARHAVHGIPSAVPRLGGILSSPTCEDDNFVVQPAIHCDAPLMSSTLFQLGVFDKNIVDGVLLPAQCHRAPARCARAVRPASARGTLAPQWLRELTSLTGRYVRTYANVQM